MELSNKTIKKNKEDINSLNKLVSYYKSHNEQLSHRYNILNETGDYRYVKISYDYDLIKKQKEKLHNQLRRNFKLYRF